MGISHHFINNRIVSKSSLVMLLFVWGHFAILDRKMYFECISEYEANTTKYNTDMEEYEVYMLEYNTNTSENDADMS